MGTAPVQTAHRVHDAPHRLGLRVGVTPVAGVPQSRLVAQVAEPRPLSGDPGLDPPGLAQQQIALPSRRGPPARAVGQVDA
ncbi:hypothetical protein F5972_22070 [Microbispora cellulosiformans]|uniref:Uncharacterized protein n=1 Tax=Microbispora cellulosiformans TaxID=2614688 RepID=A0A5J5K347_9ACTN|nr:hypothetical protein [Microbispora cellulosiformans]KAA9377116.1 hypothetical protein F5972_22070 [Microbispora cellulosiformans]